MHQMISVAEDGLAPPADAPASPLVLADPDTFRGVVETHSARLYRVAYRMTNNRQDAEDLVQETFLRAFRSAATFRADANLTTWLHRICLNATLDHLRRRGHRPESPTALDADLTPAPSPSPERLLLSREAGDRLACALRGLSPQERAAFGLRHGDQLSIEEIGAQLGLRPSATKNTIFRGVQKLRRALKETRP